MIITLNQLRQASACDEALDAFIQVTGGQTANIEWTAAAQGWVLADPLWRQWLGWAWQNSIVPMWSMWNADLQKADLRGADLREADLWEADLQDTDLRGVIIDEMTRIDDKWRPQ